MNQQHQQQNEQTNENIHSFPFLFELSKETFESVYNYLSINIIHSLFVVIDDKEVEADEKDEEKFQCMSMNGMALMSTQPRDYLFVEQLTKLHCLNTLLIILINNIIGI